MIFFVQMSRLIRCVVRNYRFGRDKQAQKVETSVDLAAKKAFDPTTIDRLKIDAEIQKVFNPYTQLGIDDKLPLDDIQRKIRIKQKVLQSEFKKINDDQNLPVYLEGRLAEVKNELEVLSKSAEIFETVESRNKFHVEYAAEVSSIIERNLTFKQRQMMKFNKSVDVVVFKAKSIVPGPVASRKMVQNTGLYKLHSITLLVA